MGWHRPRLAYGHSVRQEIDYTSAPLAQLVALGLQCEVASRTFGAVFALEDPRIGDCIPKQAGPTGCLHSAHASTREALAPSVRCSGVMEWALRPSFPHFAAAALGAPVVPDQSEEALAPSVRCSEVMDWAPCRLPFPHFSAAALGAPAVPDKSEKPGTSVQTAGVQGSTHSCFSSSTAASRRLHKVLGKVVRFETDCTGLCPSLSAVSRTLLRAARALRQRPLAEPPVSSRMEDVSCPPFLHGIPNNRSPGTQVLQKDAFPSVPEVLQAEPPPPPP